MELTTTFDILLRAFGPVFTELLHTKGPGDEELRC